MLMLFYEAVLKISSYLCWSLCTVIGESAKKKNQRLNPENKGFWLYMCVKIKSIWENYSFWEALVVSCSAIKNTIGA